MIMTPRDWDAQVSYYNRKIRELEHEIKEFECKRDAAIETRQELLDAMELLPKLEYAISLSRKNRES